MEEIVPRDRDGSKLIGGAAVGASHAPYRVRVTAGVAAAARAR
jgi:hypothetical protein